MAAVDENIAAGPSRLLIKHLLHTPLATSPDREIVYATHRRYDYRTFSQRLAQLANALTRLGVERGHVVAMMDWDSHRYLECFFAIPMLGAVLHTVNVRLSAEQILYTINHARDDWLLVHEEFLPLVAEILPCVERAPQIVVLGDDDGLPVSEGAEYGGITPRGEYEQLLEAGDRHFDFPELDENTRATTFYTTGTTGDPKGVFYSHRQIVIHTLATAAAVNMTSRQGRFHRDDVYMPITPMFHVHAWGIPFVATMMGVKQVYPGRYDPDTLLALIRDEGVTFSHCVPTILHMMLGARSASAIDLSRWKVVIGGSAMPRGLAIAARERGIDVYSGYGMSETCPVLTLAQLDESHLEAGEDVALQRRLRTGRALPLVDLSVVDEQMRPVADGVGEVVIRAPWASEGYLHDPQGSEALWRGGFLHTGDLGYVDEQGYLQITDRLKDVIKSGGEWISSLELESIVSQHPDVAEAAAIGLPDEKWGERPLLLVVAREGARPDSETLRGLVAAAAERGAISRFAVPDRIEIVDTIPKTSVGKIDKKVIRASWTSAPS